MQVEDASPALQERLGLEGTVGLLALMETARREWTANVTSLAIDRFERRLIEEVSGLRIAITEGDAALRVEFTQEIGALRTELRVEMKDLKAHVQSSILSMTRWTFGLWVGQLVATAAIVAGMFQIFLK